MKVGAGVLRGRWRLGRPMAGGAQGALHTGRDLDGQRVVLKRLKPAGAGSSRRTTDLLRVRHEAEALAQLDHPCFVRLLDAGQDEAGTWLVMERAPGRSLDACIADGQRPDPRDAARAAAELADGLAKAHSCGLLHRDIKPANLVWDGERLHLIDWGLARVRGLHEDIDAGLLLGTLPYMALEAWGLGGVVDERTDLYALAASLYEWMAGERAVEGRTAADLLRAHRAGEPEDPCRLAPELPRPVADVLLRGLKRDADDRYQTAAGLAADLRRAIEAEPHRTIPLGLQDDAGLRRSDPPFVGRAEEARAVLDRATKAGGGDGGVLLLEGDVGSGRTRLLAELAEPLRRRGALVLSARCASFEQVLPLDPIVQLLAHLRAAMPTLDVEDRAARIGAMQAAMDGRAGGVTQLVPALADLLGEGDGAPRVEVLRDALLATALPGRPTVLIIDDVHRADPASQEVLAALSRCAGGSPLVLVLSAPLEAPGEGEESSASFDEPARDFLTRVMLAGGLSVERIRLRPFDALEVEGWLDGALSGGDRDLAEWLHERTGGNPRRLGDALAAVVDGGGVVLGASGWRWDEARCDELVEGATSHARFVGSARAKRTLAATALIAPEVALEEVAEVLGAFGIAREDVARTLTAAERQGLLVPSGDRLRFRHSGARRALAEGWPAAVRAPLHARAREVLCSGREPAELPDRCLFAVAHHALKDGTDIGSVPLLRTAAARARARGDSATAVEFARAGVIRSAAAERGEALLELAEAELLRGRLAVAARTAREARLATRNGEAWAVEAEALERAGRTAEAESTARAGLAAGGVRMPSGPLGRLWATVQSTFGALWARRSREVPGRGRLLRVATRLAAARGAKEAGVLVVMSLSAARRSGAKADAAVAWGALALGLAERAGARELAWWMVSRGGGRGPGSAWLAGCRGVLAMLDGRPREARSALEQAVEGLRSAGWELEARQLLGALALAMRDGGDLEGLRRAMGREADRDPRMKAWSLVVSAWLAGLEGESRRAEELAAAAAEGARKLRDRPLEALALARRSEVASDGVVWARRAVKAAGTSRSMLALEARIIAAGVLAAAKADGGALPSLRELRGARGLQWEAERVRAAGDADALRELARTAEDDGRWWAAATVWLSLERFEDRISGQAALRWCRGCSRTTLARRAEGGAAERRLDASTEALVVRLERRDAQRSGPGEDTVAWGSEAVG